MTTDELLDEVQRRGALRNEVIYAILFRRAGVAVQWHEESRCTTPLPELAPFDGENAEASIAALRKRSEASSARTREGLVVHRYHPTLYEALKAELERLRQRS